MLDRIAVAVFKQFVNVGTITIRIADKRAITCFGKHEGQHVEVTIQSKRIFREIVMRPDLAIGEAYMNGDLKIENNDLDALMLFLMSNHKHWLKHWAGRASLAISNQFAFMRHSNLLRASKRNVAHHYDLNDTLFDSFLDPRRQYSCAYYDDSSTTIEQAQINKLARIAAKLNLQPQQHVLDIGCGWGGLANALIDCEPETHVTGITLSERQLDFANKQRDLSGRQSQLDFHLRDYRHQTGDFDRIVSVGMLEHVGPTNYDTYFKTVRDLLKPKGVAMIHSIGVYMNPHPCNRWLAKYIFPGGYLPSLEQMVKSISKQGLKILDVEIMRDHYAETLAQWRLRFRANIDAIRNDYDDRFIRMWEFYLVGCECFFRVQEGMVFQFQLAHDHTAVPLARNYITNRQKIYRDILCKTAPFGNINS
ncbi:cyclopropane-fatty-acyl-phospholipid synthase family protein [Alphaproteobacteria bacterium]|nr:cyclopropane-fatty-acyl-phospholipid synthase family protein [Alphaproteobacteria bacterium]